MKKQTSTMAAGLVISLVLIVFALVIYFMNLYTETWNAYLGIGLFVLCLVLAILNHAKEKENRVTFGQLFAYGFKTTAVVICIMIIYTLVSGYVFPDVKQNLIEKARADAMSVPNANESQVEQGMAMFEKNYTLFIIMGLLFWYLVCGAIISLITAAITPKKPVDNHEFEKV